MVELSHLPESADEYIRASEPFGKVECRQARIALGAVAPRPVRAHAAEEALRGQPLTPEAIAEAARLAVEATCCIDDLRGSAAYRQRVTEVLVRRALTDVATFPPSRKLPSFREGNS
jgi:carbon-monoxide dehydrogenase medium subunit